jgi:hypothetical protein
MLQSDKPDDTSFARTEGASPPGGPCSLSPSAPLHSTARVLRSLPRSSFSPWDLPSRSVASHVGFRRFRLGDPLRRTPHRLRLPFGHILQQPAPSAREVATGISGRAAAGGGRSEPASRGPFPQIPAFEGRCIRSGFVALPHRTAAGTPRSGASPEAAHRPSRCAASSATAPWRPERSRADLSHGEPRTESPSEAAQPKRGLA